ncbi:MAG: FimB/Mfa2 family fimbrial subunit [Bacteroides sp.]|nr:FimB/Mfa2 family fimbrial subunit [Bacteroides sp.]
MKTVARIFIGLLALLSGLSSCLTEDLSDCIGQTIALRFVFTHHDHTEETTDLFTELVEDISVYIFDENDTYLRHIQVPQTSLTNGHTLYINLEEGEYKITAWANLLEMDALVENGGKTSRADYTVGVTETHPAVTDLFHGSINLSIEDKDISKEIQLIRNTHIVRVMLLGLPEPTRSPIDHTGYSVAIQGKNTKFNFENNPVAEVTATYTPEYSGTHIDNNYIVQAEFKVQRLLMGDDTRLSILHGEEVELEDNLTDRILAAYEEIATNQDLDRHYIYELYYETNYRGGWVFIGNNIKDWDGTTMPGEL